MTRAAVHPLDYLDTADDVDVFLASITGAHAVALDTEGASFHRFVDRIYLLQLSTRSFFLVNIVLVLGWLAAATVIVREHGRLTAPRPDAEAA